MMNLDDLPYVCFSDLWLLPNASGIYFALNSDGDVLYIGLAKNIAKRWLNHHRLTDLQEFNCNRVAWQLCDEASLELSERDALLKFRPLLNGVAMRRTVAPKQLKTSSNLEDDLCSIFSKFYGVNHDRYQQDLEWSDLKGNV